MISNASQTENNNKFPPEILKREIYRLFVLSNLFNRIFKLEIEEKDGITLIEWKIIESIFHVDGIIAKDIIDFWEFEKTAASRSIIRLEKTGILKRQASQEDRRRYMLSLTAKGHKMYYKLNDFKEYVFKEIEKHLSRRELHELGNTAENMIDHLRKMVRAKEESVKSN